MDKYSVPLTSAGFTSSLQLRYLLIPLFSSHTSKSKIFCKTLQQHSTLASGFHLLHFHGLSSMIIRLNRRDLEFHIHEKKLSCYQDKSLLTLTAMAIVLHSQLIKLQPVSLLSRRTVREQLQQSARRNPNTRGKQAIVI